MPGYGPNFALSWRRIGHIVFHLLGILHSDVVSSSINDYSRRARRRQKLYLKRAQRNGVILVKNARASDDSRRGHASPAGA